MPGTYLLLAIALIVAAALGIAMVVGAYVLGPKKPSRHKEAPYECGMTPVGGARERFPIRFYVVAMLFIVFDVETVFLYPWAATFADGSRAQKLFLLGEMGVFVAILIVAYVYILGTKALDWGPEHADGRRVEPGVLDRRPPIMFGNETSNGVNLSQTVVSDRHSMSSSRD